MTTLFSVKIDKDVKEKAQKTAEAMGLPLGTVINVLLRQFAQDKELRVALDYEPTPYLKEIIREVKKEELEKGIKGYKGVNALFKALKS